MDDLNRQLISYFINRYLNRLPGKLFILDVGSLDVNGSFKELFNSDPDRYSYKGLDIIPGNNVDIVSSDPYHYPFPDNCVDAIISCSCMEHVPDLHKWIAEIVRILKPGGFTCLFAPADFLHYHRYPVDCWRIYPDGMKFLLADIAKLKILKMRTKRVGRKYRTCFAVAQKGEA